MKRMLINATQLEELRVALVDGQRLYDLDIENRTREQKKANIYKGRIARVEPSLEAAFVDYGADRHGFLPLKEISREYFTGDTQGRVKIQESVKEGTEVIVQVDKEERGNKGAALTTFVSLAGRYLVLMPNNPRAGGISRRIEGDERSELRDAMRDLNIPKGMGVIVRTAGIGRTAEELQWDLDYLVQLWTTVKEQGDSLSAPHFLFQESNVIIRAIRDYLRPDIGEVIVDTPEAYALCSAFVQQVMPSFASKIKLYQDPIPLFNRYQVENQIETAFLREVKLPSGGSIVIDVTEALISIDINSSRSTKGVDIEETATKTNLEAADEIARQLRLRDMGGLVVIDFIDMSNSKNQRDVENRMKDALDIDRARVQVGRISRFGLLEMSRQRLRPSLEETIFKICPRCDGQGTIRGTRSLALSILRLVEEEAQKEFSSEIRAITPVSVATYLLNEKRGEIADIEKRNKLKVLIIPNSHMETPQFEVQRYREQDEVVSLTSYKLAEELAPQQQAEAAETQPLPTPQQPAVQQFVHTAPAPMVEPKEKVPEVEQPAEPPTKEETSSPGFFRKIADLLFGNKKKEQERLEEEARKKREEEEEARKKSESNRNRRNNGRNNRNNRNNRKRPSGQNSQSPQQDKNQDENRQQDAKRDDKRERDNRKNPRNRRQEQDTGGNTPDDQQQSTTEDAQSSDTKRSDAPPKRTNKKRRDPRRTRNRQELPEELQQVKKKVSIPVEETTGVAAEAKQESPITSAETDAPKAEEIQPEATQAPVTADTFAEKHLEPVAEDKAAVDSNADEAPSTTQESSTTSQEALETTAAVDADEKNAQPEVTAAPVEAQAETTEVPATPEAEDTTQDETPLVLELPVAKTDRTSGPKTASENLTAVEGTPEPEELSFNTQVSEPESAKQPEEATQPDPEVALAPTPHTDTPAESVEATEAEATEINATESGSATAVDAQETTEGAATETQNQPAPQESTTAGSTRASNDPRLQPRPVTELQIVTETPAPIFSDALDTSLPAPIAVAPSNLQRPSNDPRLARRAQKENSQQELLPESSAENS